MKVGVIGAGNMGSAFARLVLKKKLVGPQSMVLVERDTEKRAVLSAEFAGPILSAVDSTIGECSILILAVKPQDFSSTAEVLRGVIQPHQTVLSFMAGVKMDRISSELGGHSAIVRSMPNLPFQIGQGMTAYIANAGLSESQRNDAEILLNACGATLQVDKELLLDAATAVSGTGPAYVFYLVEHWISAAVALGFDRESATTLVRETLLGASNLWAQGSVAAEDLRKQVTSKGGTTHAAISFLDENAVPALVQSGIRRAFERSVELSSS